MRRFLLAAALVAAVLACGGCPDKPGKSIADRFCSLSRAQRTQVYAEMTQLGYGEMGLLRYWAECRNGTKPCVVCCSGKPLRALKQAVARAERGK